MRRLDTLLEEHPDFQPNFIKIDVEGAGDSLVEGARQLFHEFKPTCHVEYHTANERLAICKTLKSAGYRGIRFDSKQRPHWTDPASAPAYFGHPDQLIASVLRQMDDANG